MTQRTQHWTDTPLGGGRMRRRISNWANFQTPGRSWAESAPGLRTSQGKPPNWSGAYDFSFESLDAPLQCFFRDSMAVGNRAMVGVRRSDTPRSWLNIRALGGSAVDAVLGRDGRSATWSELWPGCDLTFRCGRHRLDKEITCKAPGHQTVFEFSLKLAAQHTIEFVGGGAVIKDRNGVESLSVRAPWAHDSATTGNTPEGHQIIGVTLEDGGVARGNQIIRLVVDPNDLDTAVYPVVVDPTVVISGVTDIEDTFITSNIVTVNFGGSDKMNWRNSPDWNVLVRVLSFPDGVISGLRFYHWDIQAAAGNASVYRVAAGNDWVEGTTPGSYQYSSCCYNQCKASVKNWAGGPGCNVSGTDYLADASPPTFLGVPGWNEWVLPPEWIPDWRDGVVPNQGFVSFSTSATYHQAYTTESAVTPLYFEIDYLVGLPRRGLGRGLNRGLVRGF